MESAGHQTLAQRLSSRTLANARMASVVLVGLSGLLFLKLRFFPTPDGAGPLGSMYFGVYTMMSGYFLVAAGLAHGKPWRWVPGALALGSLFLGMALTWVDVHFGDDYTAYTIAIFALGVFFPAKPWVYALLLAVSFVTLSAAIGTTMPEKMRWSELGTRLVVVFLAYVGCTQLEKQRKNSDELAVQLEVLNAELRESAIRDVLTGLYNRRFLLEFLESRRALSFRMKIPLSVVLIDLDHFKSINDRFGHPVGDRVLKGLSKALLAGIRESDLAARYGGEEFLLVLPQATEENAARVTERILEAVREIRFPGVPEPVTFSAGVAEILEKEPVETLLSRADNRLYLAKKVRNRVVSSEP